VKVLYVIDSLAGGGAERSLAVMAPHYAERGAELEVAYLKRANGVQAELERAGVRVFDLSGRGGRIDAIGRCARLIRFRRPDLVHTTLFEADVAGRAAGAIARVPVVSSLVNVAYSEAHLADPHLRPWRVRAAQVADALSARRVARFHAITVHVADEMARRLRIERSRIDVVPRGRDPERLGRRTRSRRARARKGLGIEPRTPVVLAAARHEYQKGLDVLVAAFPAVLQEQPRARLVVAGREGNQTDELRDTARRLGVESSVSFLGVRTDVEDLMCAADLFVLPSRWEGLGSVLLEAMALRAPIVATDLGPVRETVGDGVARLVPVESPDDLARAIADTLRDPGARADMAARGAARFADRFTIDRVTDGMMGFYRRALAPREVLA
jgi:glycosyltransferase involved in cell wall biosynthesis